MHCAHRVSAECVSYLVCVLNIVYIGARLGCSRTTRFSNTAALFSSLNCIYRTCIYCFEPSSECLARSMEASAGSVEAKRELGQEPGQDIFANGVSRSLLVKAVLYQRWRDGEKASSWKEVRRLLGSECSYRSLHSTFWSWKHGNEHQWHRAQAEAAADPDTYFLEIVSPSPAIPCRGFHLTISCAG